MKLESRGFDYYLNKYAQSTFGKDFQLLSEKERASVYYIIIEKAGGADSKVTAKVRKLQIMGKAFLLLSAVLATYQIIGADNKIRETTRQGSIILGGMIGYSAAGMGATLLCGPAEPACALIVVLIGAYAGSQIAETANNIYQDELAIFSRWIKE